MFVRTLGPCVALDRRVCQRQVPQAGYYCHHDVASRSLTANAQPCRQNPEPTCKGLTATMHMSQAVCCSCQVTQRAGHSHVRGEIAKVTVGREHVTSPVVADTVQFPPFTCIGGEHVWLMGDRWTAYTGGMQLWKHSAQQPRLKPRLHSR
jgi:hypothetical protein